MKKFLAMALALLMVAVLLPVTAMAEVTALPARGTTLPDAVGGVIKLTEDVTLSDMVTFGEGKTVTLNLNGKTLTGPTNNKPAISVNNATLTITGNGTISGYAAVQVVGNTTRSGEATKSVLVVENGTLTGSEYGILFIGNGADVTVNGGTITGGDNAAIMSNGTVNDTSDQGHTKLVVNGGTITGNTRTQGYANCAIYLPNSGTAMINGGTIKGTTGAGIVVRGGSLTVNGGTIEGHGQGGDNIKMGDANPTYCGGIEVGFSTNYPGGIADVKIAGGTISSETSEAFLVIGEKPTDGASANATITVTGGTFNGQYTEKVAGYFPQGSDLVIKDGKVQPRTITIIVPSEGGSTTTTPSTDTTKNPSTGANDFVGVAAAAAVMALLGSAVVLRKK